MLNENKLWEPTEKQFLAPQEKAAMIKQEIDKIIKDFLKRDSKTIKTEELYTEISKIDSYQKMAEDSGDENLPKYLSDKIEELKTHKNSGIKVKMGTMTPFTRVNDPRRRRIGTHN